MKTIQERMNKELLLEIKNRILREPALVNMDSYLCMRDRNNNEVLSAFDRDKICNTTACIAGWAVVIEDGLENAMNRELSFGHLERPVSCYFRAQELLNLTEDEAFPLFNDSCWPVDLHDRLSDYKEGTPEYAEVVAKAIDRFIADPDEFTTEEDDE